MRQVRTFVPDQISVIPPLFLLKIIIPINKLSAKPYDLAQLLLCALNETCRQKVLYRQQGSEGMGRGLIHQLQHHREVERPNNHCRRNGKAREVKTVKFFPLAFCEVNSDWTREERSAWQVVLLIVVGGCTEL